MKLLFDQGTPTPVPLRQYLKPHSVETAYARGWGNIRNGDLLSRAEAEGFDALVTTDQNIRYQQSLTGRKIGIVVLLTTSWPRIKKHTTEIALVINNLKQGDYLEIPIS